MSEDIRLLDRIAVNATEAAKLLGVSRPTLYALMHREDFPCIRPTGPGGPGTYPGGRAKGVGCRPAKRKGV